MRYGFFNNTTVWAEDFAKFAAGILTNGVLAELDGSLLVTAAEGMKVSVAAGYVWIDGHFGLNEDAITITLETSDGTYPRIDRIVARLNLSEKSITLKAITGEPAAVPSAPEIVRDGNIYDLGLATVSLAAGTLEITSDMINDTRRNENVCGGVYPRMSDAFVYPGANHFGDIKMTAAAAAPDGWLICDGSALSRVRYADLFAAIGTAYGEGDGSTTFNIPDMRGRVAFGKNSETFSSLGSTGGAETHTLTVAELANHGHTVSQSAAYGNKYYDLGSSVNKVFGEDTEFSGYYAQSLNISVGNTGSNQPFSLLPPYNTVNYIIYTGVTS